MRDIPVGNGSLLVNFDEFYQIRDVYFPHVGQENHTEGYPFRFGVWADGDFAWTFQESWGRELRYISETLVTDIKLTNESLGIEIVSNDTVASHEDIFLRRVCVSLLVDERFHCHKAVEEAGLRRSIPSAATHARNPTSQNTRAVEAPCTGT